MLADRFEKTPRNIRTIAIYVFATLLACSSFAQENKSVEYPSYSEEHIREVKRLISKGTSLRWNAPDSAFHYYRLAEQLSREKGITSGIGYALAYMGIAATESGKNDEAFKYYWEALPYCHEPGPFRNALAILYLHMGVSWHAKGSYVNANECYYKALSVIHPNHPKNQGLIASIHNNISSLKQVTGDPREGLHHATLAEQIGRMRNDLPLLASTLINKACAYRQLKIQDSAEQIFKAALDLSRANRLNSMAEAALTNLGIMMGDFGQYEQALNYLREAMNVSANTNEYYGKVTPGYYAGMALYKLKRFKEAETILLQSIKRAEAIGYIERKEIAYETLANVYEETGNPTQALKYYRLHQQLSDSLNNLEKIRVINELEFRFNSAQKDRQIALNELKIALQDRRMAQNKIVMIVLLVGLLVIGIGVTFYYRQRLKLSRRDREIERLKAVMSGEENERKRISQELHDGIGGMLTGIMMNMKVVQKQVSSPETAASVTNVMDMLQKMGGEIHKTAHNLMPDIVLNHGLTDALRIFIAQLDGKEQLQISLQVQGNVDDLDKHLELTLYRIIQELVQNIVKYAQAYTAAIQIRRENEKIFISVEDDGVGFEVGTTHGLGLLNIESRIRALNGFFSIESAKNMGTTAYIELDLTKIQQANHDDKGHHSR